MNDENSTTAGTKSRKTLRKSEDEPPEQKSCYQSRPDQREQRRIFECHGRSINIVGVIRNSGCSNRETLKHRGTGKHSGILGD